MSDNLLIDTSFDDTPSSVPNGANLTVEPLIPVSNSKKQASGKPEDSLNEFLNNSSSLPPAHPNPNCNVGDDLMSFSPVVQHKVESK